MDTILVKSVDISGQSLEESSGGGLKFVAHKMGCGCNWCKDCSSRRGLPVITRTIMGMHYAYVRHVTITVARSLFGSGREAWIAGGRRLNRLLMALNRDRGIKDYVWVLEWHEDGFPHWHIVIEMEEGGRASRIGQDWLHEHWFEGSRVHEQYFHSAWDFRRFAGYLQKTGYFGEKGHQGTLPAWALGEKQIIRRFGRKNRNCRLVQVVKEKLSTCMRRGRISYREILESCGCNTRLSVHFEGKEVAAWVLSVPYCEVRKNWAGEYEIGVGFVVSESWNYLKGILEEYGEWENSLVPF